MDVLDGNRERALRYLYLLTTFMLVTLRGGLKTSQSDMSHNPVTPQEVPTLRGSERRASSKDSNAISYILTWPRRVSPQSTKMHRTASAGVLSFVSTKLGHSTVQKGQLTVYTTTHQHLTLTSLLLQVTREDSACSLDIPFAKGYERSKAYYKISLGLTLSLLTASQLRSPNCRSSF